MDSCLGRARLFIHCESHVHMKADKTAVEKQTRVLVYMLVDNALKHLYTNLDAECLWSNVRYFTHFSSAGSSLREYFL